MANKPVDTSVEESQSNAAARRKKGEFVRGVSGFRSWIGDDDFPAEPGRYHLFLSFNCPWSHRASLARAVLGLEDSITVDVAFPSRTGEDDPDGPNHWQFAPDKVAFHTGKPLKECTLETATGQSLRLVRDVYALEGSAEKSVPVLFDKKTKRIVNNESAEIVRMLGQHAHALGGKCTGLVLYPEPLRAEIDELNQQIYVAINNGAYKAGFSSDQKVYGAAYLAYFDMLDQLNERLSDGRKYLTGNEFTEADLRLFPTLYRHDPVYYLRMKLNGAKMLDYPHLWRWLCRVYALPGVAQSNSLDHCKQGYFGRSWNNVVPLGPFKPMQYPQAYHHPDLARD